MDDLAAATFAIRTESVTAGTNQKTATAWRRWTSYLRSIDVVDDNFLESFSVDQRLQIVLAFAAAMRGARFSPGYTRIKEGSVHSTVDYVAQVFRANNRRDPRLDSSDVKSFLLSRLLRAYRNTDPDVKHQKAVPVSLIRLVLSSASSPFEFFNAHLLIVAFFFAMRSCEYTKVSQSEIHPEASRRTKLLCLRNFRFFRGSCLLDTFHDDLFSADSISITFEFQKNDKRQETVTQEKSNDPLLCPVRSAASIIMFIVRIPGASPTTSINSFRSDDGSVILVSSSMILATLRAAADSMGEDVLGFASSEIGCHSIRSACAMALFLAGYAEFTIMLIGRWRSYSFLRYIRKQIQQFYSGISSHMIQQEHFFTIPRL